MVHLGLTKRQTEAFYAALKSSHRIKIKVAIHNSDEEKVNDFDFRWGDTHLLEGAVQFDTSQDVTRSLSMTFLDPFKRFRWSPDRTSHGTLYSGDFISVKYCVHVPYDNLQVGGSSVSPKTVLGMQPVTSRKRKSWVEIPVFWGPLTAYEANGPEITIEAQGKEALALDPFFMNQGFTLHKHQHTDDAIKEVMRRVGESRFQIPNLPFRLHEKRVIHPRSEPWKVIAGGEEDNKSRKVAGLVHRTGKHPHHLFFSGDGRLTMRRLNKEPDFTFDSTTLLSDPDEVWDSLSFINHVVVTGAKPQGKGKKAAKAAVSLRRKHPLSPWSLARNGKPLYRTLFVDAENLKSDRECRQRAHHILNHHSMVGLEASFDALPIPTFEPGDYIRIKVDDLNIKMVLKQWTLPLTSDQGMTVGDNTRIRTKGRRKGNRHRGGSAGPPGGTGGSHQHHSQDGR